MAKQTIRMAGDKPNQYFKTFEDHHANYTKPKSDERRSSAQEAMGDGYKKDISQYDHAAYGRKSFDMKDVEHLRGAGYSDKQISKYTSGLEANQLAKDIRLNNTAFAGAHAQGDLKKGHKIGDHDLGKYITSDDVRYLKDQGYDHDAIAKHIHSTVTSDPGSVKHGKGIAKYMNNRGYLDYKQNEYKSYGLPEEEKGKQPQPTPTPTPTEPTPEPETPSYKPPKGGFQGINVGYPGLAVNQNNDINSSVVGNNNTVTNTQDNSIKTFGSYGSSERAKQLRDKYVADVSRFGGAS